MLDKGYIYIENITDKDYSKKQVRIIVRNKFLFPDEIIGISKVYNLIIIIGSNEFQTTYRIGSKDGKSRSGVLKTDFDKWGINFGSVLKVIKVKPFVYQIDKV